MIALALRRGRFSLTEAHSSAFFCSFKKKFSDSSSPVTETEIFYPFGPTGKMERDSIRECKDRTSN